MLSSFLNSRDFKMEFLAKSDVCFVGFFHSVEKDWFDGSNVSPAKRTLSAPLMDLTRALGTLTDMEAR